jgi:TRCF domain
LLDEMSDRYGAPPAAVLNLADYGRVRVGADRLGLETIDRDGSLVVFKFRERTKVDLPRLLTLVRSRQDLLLVPPGSLKLDVRQGAPAAGKGRRGWWTARPKFSGKWPTIRGPRAVCSTVSSACCWPCRTHERC